MRLSKKIFIILTLSFICGTQIILPLIAHAADDTFHLVFTPPCMDLGIAGLTSCTEPKTLQEYIVRIYQFALGISGVTAVGMIVYGAITIITKSENIVAKSEGRQIIQDALWGVVLLFASFLLLKTINPELVKLKEPEASIITTASTSTLDQLEMGSCGTSTDIQAVPGVPIYAGDSTKNVQAPQAPDGTKIEPNNRCGFRRVLLRHEADITDNTDATSQYYAEDENLDENTIVWTYPYFKKGQDPGTTAQCVIYAVREPVDEDEKATTMMIDLNQGITPCLLNDKQAPGWIWGNDATAVRENANETVISSTTLKLVKEKAEFLKNTGKVSLNGSGDCAPKNETSANGVFQALLNQAPPYICSSDCSCEKGNLTVSVNLLESLISLAGRTKGFSITSLTGGAHSSNSAHYKGVAADITPKDNDWDTLHDKAEEIFNTNQLFCEVYYNSASMDKIKKMTQKYNVMDSGNGNLVVQKHSDYVDCYKSGSLYHCMSNTNGHGLSGCWSIFFEDGHTGNHIHVQAK